MSESPTASADEKGPKCKWRRKGSSSSKQKTHRETPGKRVLDAGARRLRAASTFARSALRPPIFLTIIGFRNAYNLRLGRKRLLKLSPFYLKFHSSTQELELKGERELLSHVARRQGRVGDASEMRRVQGNKLHRSDLESGCREYLGIDFKCVLWTRTGERDPRTVIGWYAKGIQATAAACAGVNQWGTAAFCWLGPRALASGGHKEDGGKKMNIFEGLLMRPTHTIPRQ
ncbi:hypothetical protein K438DRAFT_1760037 [Mycena galopus ATCC 62051]|nr:hypothetical protein K438DRAFT_1760037 [Mycena galopus ATCC 62051]